MGLKISSFIINYNDSQYLPEQLNSILAQIRPPDELIFCDDGSTDDSLEIAEFYRSEFEEIGVEYTVYQAPKNMGICGIANYAASLAKYELLSGGCSTDRYLPNFFQKQAKAFELYPSAGLAFSDPYHFTDRGGSNPNELNLPSEFNHFSPEKTCQFLKQQSFISGFTTVYKTELWKKFGGLRPEFAHHSDWFLNLKIASIYDVVAIKGPLAQTRWRAEGYAEKGVHNPKIQTETLDKLAEEARIDTELRNFMLASDSWRWLGNGQYLRDSLK